MLDITQQKGLITEFHCLSDFVELGYQCLLPYGDSCKYDVAVDIDGKILKIQCKTSRWSVDTKEPETAFEINTCCQTTNTQKTVRHKYSDKEIDYFYTWFQGQGYLVSIQEATGTTFRWRYVYPPTGQKMGIHIAKNYELRKVLEEII
jgi:hypothetical protein